MTAFLAPLAGGALIGAAAALLLLVNGRIAGISGIVGGLLGLAGRDVGWRVAFLVGLLLGPVLFRLAAGHWPEVRLEAPLDASEALSSDTARGSAPPARAATACAALRGSRRAPSRRSPPSWRPPSSPCS